MKALLTVRSLLETALGFICMSTLFLLPGIWQGAFPDTVILGYLGMPRRFHPGPMDLSKFKIAAALSSLLVVTIFIATGALCFKHVFKTLRKLRLSHHES